MGSMNQVGHISQLTQTNPLFLEVAQQQVTTRAPIIGKFFASDWDRQEAWNRFYQFNSHMIGHADVRRSRFYMKDGTVYCYRTFETYEDVQKIAGAEYYSADIDRDIVDPKILNYIHTRIRWCY